MLNFSAASYLFPDIIICEEAYATQLDDGRYFFMTTLYTVTKRGGDQASDPVVAMSICSLEEFSAPDSPLSWLYRELAFGMGSWRPASLDETIVVLAILSNLMADK